MFPLSDSVPGDTGYPMYSAAAGGQLLQRMNLSHTIHVLKQWDILSPLYDMHVHGSGDHGHNTDCTHWCGTPGLYLPIFERSRVLALRNKQEAETKKHPSFFF